MSLTVSRGWLLDTCLVSESRKRKPDPGVVSWLETLILSDAFISAVTMAELAMGVAKLKARADPQLANYENWIGAVKDRFGHAILPADDQVWSFWAQWMGEASARGIPRPPLDALLVSTAQMHGLTIVTRNVKDFAPYPLIHNPWTGVDAAV